MLKRIVLSGILLMMVISSCMMGNRPFPKKYLGSYEGTQDPYQVKVNDEEVMIPAAEFSLELAYNELWLTTEKQVIHGTYDIKETEMYYAFVVNMKNGVTEEWQLWKKGGKLVRKEMTPKPEVVFVISD